MKDGAESRPTRFALTDARAGAPVIMAVVNRSTDSFYESAATLEAALRAVDAAAEAGARIVDIGGVRAGRGREISVAEEIERVVPVVEAVIRRRPDLLISVDTWRHEVAEAVCAAGAGLLNDTWAGADPLVAEVAARFDVGLVCSHTGGLSPRTDAHRSRYGLTAADVVDETLSGVVALATAAEAAGVDPTRIVIDPTPDFGKNSYHSLRLLRDLGRFAETGYPVLLAISRKDFVGEAIGEVGPADRLHGTIAATALAVERGAAIIRAHDVTATADALAVTLAVTGEGPARHTVRGLR
ncbi:MULTISPECIES: dihydropteroate synthase [Brevibacterium]|uniref:Dihydropteroate synthase n=3 Tax=Brevibacterium casei TaxID=33889 RepID=K9AQ98_9MICO|nr:dihydropteroate synthase [Brevibacterium casei]SII44203.1 dihydropteroate synthase [Mycobacteroides abscessus subsp. abscessus]EKU49429.1 dihydropteroate synthase [Brevibacterium casei S18]MCT1448199.1 dihydropteroate synthase [Brevibacterium casei]MCT1551077.1 dihydropteroate synthase [Brevibacterium casei]MCT1560543.1 dihydropteroate synthase [Brevibacterium casei]